MKNKMLYIPIFFILVVFYASFYFYKNSTPKQNSINFKCPEYYATDSEYSSSIDKYIHQEVSSNPNATAEDIMRKRYKLLVDNHCEVTLQNLKDKLPSGSGATPSDIIQNELKTYNSTK